MAPVIKMRQEVGTPYATLTQQNQIRTYFEKVLELHRSGKPFPVNLDDVWPRVYANKSNAVRALVKDFIEGVDYVSFIQNDEPVNQAVINPNPKTEYLLSVPCLEHFYARKVREVFEVYRQVFHAAVSAVPMTQAELSLQQAQILVTHERRLGDMEAKVSTLLEARAIAEEELQYIPLSNEPVPEMDKKSLIRSSVNKYSVAMLVNPPDVWNKVYSEVYYRYHVSIKAYKKLKNTESWLEVAERNGHLDKIYNVISSLIRESGIQAA